MRRPKLSLKRYFYLILICALLLIFGLSLRERELWRPKTPTVAITLHAAAATPQTPPLSVENDIIEDNEEELNAAAVSNEDGNSENHSQQKLIAAPLMASSSSNLSNENENDDRGSQLEQHPAEVDDDENAQQAASTALPWFFKNGEYYPKPAELPATASSAQRKGKRKTLNAQGARLFPHQNPHSDRIFRQLMYVPPNYEQLRQSGKRKTILLYNGVGPWNVKMGRDVFLRSKCPVDTCELTANRDRASTADMILYKDHFLPTGLRRPANSKQITMLYYLECPYHTQNVKVPDGVNWTATYRRDSDIVAPYEKWLYYNPKVRQIEQDKNYAANKTKKVAWFVSNCGARNGRLNFAHELQKYIDVDIYGACGNFKCPRSNADKCFDILDNDYKFYLAFENSNCKNYITEKFFVNALNRNILPIVMGARPEDYEVSSPYRSYIHVDEFATAKELADYLHKLDKDDDLYNSYFNWKGTGEFINTYYWCRVCAALHDEESLKTPKWYPDVNDWWRGAGVCTNGSWRNAKARKDVISDD